MAISIVVVLGSVVVAYLIAALAQALYNIYFHPLAKYPGPSIRAGWYFPSLWELYTGNGIHNVRELHRRYGTVVRIAPDALSFITAQAWKDIYGFRSNKSQIPKDYKRFPDVPDALPILASNDSDHARIRKLMSHAFSDVALLEQQPLLRSHIDTFIAQLQKRADAAETADMNMWLNLLAFDIITDLSFGEPLGGLHGAQKDPFIGEFFTSCHLFPFIPAAWTYPAVRAMLAALMAIPSFKRQQESGYRNTQDKVQRRINKGELADRKDFTTYILRYNDERGMTQSEIVGTTAVLVNAGGESTAAVMTASIYYLLKRPEALQRVQDEVRSAFSTPEEIDSRQTARLPYLQAVIQEALRLFPPTSGMFARRTGPHGDMIDGQFVPPDTSVGVHSWSANRSPLNFADPDAFVPERWLDGERPDAYHRDRREALQPWSLGPRNCLGRNLAHLEIRSVLARVVWSFDMKLEDPDYQWDAGVLQGVIWFRRRLDVKLERRQE